MAKKTENTAKSKAAKTPSKPRSPEKGTPVSKKPRSTAQRVRATAKPAARRAVEASKPVRKPVDRKTAVKAAAAVPEPVNRHGKTRAEKTRDDQASAALAACGRV